MKVAGSSIGTPFQHTPPACTGSSPTTAFSRVDLPEPTRPVTTVTWPRRRVKLASRMPWPELGCSEVRPRTCSASSRGAPVTTLGAVGAAAVITTSGASSSRVVMRMKATSAVRLRASSRPSHRGAEVAAGT